MITVTKLVHTDGAEYVLRENSNCVVDIARFSSLQVSVYHLYITNKIQRIPVNCCFVAFGGEIGID